MYFYSQQLWWKNRKKFYAYSVQKKKEYLFHSITCTIISDEQRKFLLYIKWVKASDTDYTIVSCIEITPLCKQNHFLINVSTHSNPSITKATKKKIWMVNEFFSMVDSSRNRQLFKKRSIQITQLKSTIEIEYVELSNVF